MDSLVQRLIEGNRRHVSGEACASRLFADHSGGQAPFAAILGCADSRVPPELVFDQEPGDLFVVRVAGNVAGASELGSLEFAVGGLGVELIVVLGHSRCGAVAAAVDAVAGKAGAMPDHLGALVSSIEPVVGDVAVVDRGESIARAVRANVVRSAEALRENSSALGAAVDSGQLRIVGAEYRLESGEVDFFHGV